MNSERTSWKRYWRLVHAVDPSARSPLDVFADRVGCSARGRWLDAGCGRKTLPQWRHDELPRLLQDGTVLFGCDTELVALRERRGDLSRVCVATLDELPFRDASFDFVSTNMVFEHLTNPTLTVREMARVTKPGGRILVHTVNGFHHLAWLAQLTPYRFHRWIVERLEGRQHVDVYPTKYRANTLGRVRCLFEASGCRYADGGLVDGIPLFVPYRGLFEMAIALGLIERRLARVAGLRNFLCPNLLVEFERMPPGEHQLRSGATERSSFENEAVRAKHSEGGRP